MTPEQKKLIKKYLAGNSKLQEFIAGEDYIGLWNYWFSQDHSDEGKAFMLNLLTALSELGVEFNGEYNILQNSFSEMKKCPEVVNDIKLPVGLNEIYAYSFHSNPWLQSVEFPEGLTNISNFSFYGNFNLQKINFPSSLKTIGKRAFRGCDLLELDLSGLQVNIGEGAFSLCSKLGTIILPEYLKDKRVEIGLGQYKEEDIKWV